MAEWSEFAGAMLVFIGSHALTARPAWKSALVARLGHAGFGLLYSALSIGLLAWVIVAAGRAPFVPLWPPGRWQVWLALGLMLAASLLLVPFVFMKMNITRTWGIVLTALYAAYVVAVLV